MRHRNPMEHRQPSATMLTNLGIEPPEANPLHYWNSIQTGPAPIDVGV